MDEIMYHKWNPSETPEWAKLGMCQLLNKLFEQTHDIASTSIAVPTREQFDELSKMYNESDNIYSKGEEYIATNTKFLNTTIGQLKKLHDDFKWPEQYVIHNGKKVPYDVLSDIVNTTHNIEKLMAKVTSDALWLFESVDCPKYVKMVGVVSHVEDEHGKSERGD